MFAYLIRRLLYAVPIVLGVMLITFVLFFVVQSPEALARRVLGPKASPRPSRTGCTIGVTTNRFSSIATFG